MERQRRVVITGLGAVTPLGADLAASVAALRRGEAARTGELAPAAAGERAPIATVPDFEPRRHFSVPKALKVCDRRTRMAVAAAAMAMADAGLSGGEAAGLEIGVVLGTSSSDPGVEDLARPLGGDGGERAAEDVAFFAERILGRLHPLWLLVQLPNMASAHVAIQLGLQGPNSTVMTDWVAGAQALGEAYRWIQQGEAQAVLAGGADAGTNQLTQICYRQSGLFAPAAGDPGPPLAEGAAVLVLEALDHALARGAAIRGEFVGYAAAGDPGAAAEGPGGGDGHGGPAGCRPGGMTSAIRQALAEAAWAPASLAWLLPGGTASAAQHQAEAAALRAAGCEPPPPRFDLTPWMGHALAAQAPIALCLALALGGDGGGAAPIGGLASRAEGAGATGRCGSGNRMLCNSVGFLGQAVGLAVAGHGRPWEVAGAAVRA